MRKLFFLILGVLFALLLSLISSISASANTPPTLDLLIEAPNWIEQDKEANFNLRYLAPQLIPPEFISKNENSKILEETKMYRIKNNLYDAKTKSFFPFKDSNLLALSRTLKPDYFLYLTFHKDSTTQEISALGEKPAPPVPLTLSVYLIDTKKQKIIFNEHFLGIEHTDDVIELGTHNGIPRNRPGNPYRALTPSEATQIALTRAKVKLTPFLENLL